MAVFDNQHSILDTSLEFLKGIGSIRAALLRTELQLTNYESLLHYYPYRYDNRSQILPINAINHQTDTASIAGTLANFRLEGEGAKRRLVATLYDETGRIELVWFQAIAWTKNNLKEGEKYLVYGKVNFFNGIFNIAHPEVELLKSASSMAGLQ
ncbi:MAG: ATP-dependent DNA helicase RecG, partial [Chitinophagia bacterium]|nr:ATP-dependent DNA helicase RecG [Chitinophagia bacterium]